MRVIWICTECRARVSDSKKEGKEEFPKCSVDAWCPNCRKFTRQTTT